RTQHGATSERVSSVQGRYYEIGAEMSRLEQTIQHTRELRERQRTDLAKTRTTLTELGAHIERDERQLAELAEEIARSTPELERAQAAETASAEALEAAERELAAWQERWEQWNQALGAADRTTQVERARIEQLENQLRRLKGQVERLTLERETLEAQESSELLAELTDQESHARGESDSLANALRTALERVQAARSSQLAAEEDLETARGERERTRAECTSLEAVQKAALSASAGQATEWLSEVGLSGRTRIAQTLEVESGWELAVETALGDYLEAVCVDRIDELAAPLERLSRGRVALVEGAHAPHAANTAAPGGPGAQGLLAGKVAGPDSVLAPGESVITRGGEWLGRDWLRVSRGVDHHLGVIEREHRLKTLRAAVESVEERVRHAEDRLTEVRESLDRAEAERDAAQAGIQAAHRRHAD